MWKKCEICGKDFETIHNGDSRKYCFDCSPTNCSRQERTNKKRQAAKIEGVKRLGGKCLKCGETRPYILAFHHINPKEKDDGPAHLLGNSQFNAFFKEIEKCILLCNNYHGEFHYLQDNENITLEDYLAR